MNKSQEEHGRNCAASPDQRRPAAARSVVAFLAMMLALAVGCASTKVTRSPVATGHLPRPGSVWVYDFAATAADLPADSALVGEFPADPADQTPEQLAHGRTLGALVATEVVESLRMTGMAMRHADAATVPQINDLVIRGCLVSFDEGDAKKRVRIGFGAGASEVKAMAEGLQMTAQGLRRLGSGTADAGGSKTPGAVMGVVGWAATSNPAGLIIGGAAKVRGERTGSSKVEGRAKQIGQEIGDILKERFKAQGWTR